VEEVHNLLLVLQPNCVLWWVLKYHTRFGMIKTPRDLFSIFGNWTIFLVDSIGFASDEVHLYAVIIAFAFSRVQVG